MFAAVWIYTLICAVLIGFQAALVAGAPWGHLTQGGRFSGALPRQGRILAALSILILAFMAAAIRSAGGLSPNWPVWTGWLALAVTVMTTIANWITPSRPERRIWGPVTAVLLVTGLWVVTGS